MEVSNKICRFGVEIEDRWQLRRNCGNRQIGERDVPVDVCGNAGVSKVIQRCVYREGGDTRRDPGVADFDFVASQKDWNRDSEIDWRIPARNNIEWLERDLTAVLV